MVERRCLLSNSHGVIGQPLVVLKLLFLASDSLMGKKEGGVRGDYVIR